MLPTPGQYCEMHGRAVAVLDMCEAKWLSLDNHIHNIHRGRGKPFPKCEHPRLPRHGRTKKVVQAT